MNGPDLVGLARAIAVLGAVSVIGTATQVAKGKLGALFLGAAGVGVFSQLTTLYGLLFIVAGLGFFNGMMRQITLAVKDGDDGNTARPQMNSVSLFLGATSLVITVACLLASGLISDLLFADRGERAPLVALVVLAVPVAVQQRVFRAYLNAVRDLKGIARAQTAADVASVAIFAAGAWFYGIWGAIASFIAMHMLLLLGMAFFAVRRGGAELALPHLRHFRWSEVKANFGYGINGLIMTVAASGTAIVIGRMIITKYDLAQAGIFSVAFKVATVYLGALYAAAGSYYFPTLVRLDERAALENEANRAVALYMTILPPVILGLVAFGDVLIPLLFSDEFRPAVMVMAGLLLGDVLRVTSETMGLTLLARQELLPYTTLYLIYTAGFIGLSWWLLLQLGLLGVAYAYIAMRTLDFALIMLACKRSLGISLTGIGGKPLMLALLAVAPVTVAGILGVTLTFKLALAIAVGLAWLGLSWRLPEPTKLRTALIEKLAKK